MKPFIGYYGFWVILTYISAASAVIGMGYALAGNIRYALICLMVSGLCDTLDGKVASLKDRTDREKKYGIEIDNLADVISFGALPAVIGFAVMQSCPVPFCWFNIIILAVYVLAALIRLAYFGVIEVELLGKNEKRTYYEGMPVTIVSLIIPVVYSLCNLLEVAFSDVYFIMIALIAVAFVAKVRIPKIGGKIKIALCLFGLPVIFYIITAGM